MKDYRVNVEIRFDLDVPAESRGAAESTAAQITSEVMRESFSRAECVTISAEYAKPVLQERTPR